MIELHYRYKDYPKHEGGFDRRHEFGLRTDEPTKEDFKKSFAFLITTMIQEKKLILNLEYELNWILPFFAEGFDRITFEEGETTSAGILTKEKRYIYTVEKRNFIHNGKVVHLPDLNKDDEDDEIEDGKEPNI